MDIVATFPADDAEGKKLFEEWREMGADVRIEHGEKQFTGGPETLVAITTLTPIITFLIGKYFDLLMARQIEIDYEGGKILAKGYSVKKVAEFLAHASKKA